MTLTIKTLEGKRYIEADGHTYEPVDTVFISEGIRGRGTFCWHAHCDGQEYAIKDTWADVSHKYNEATILDMAKDVVGLPKVAWHDEVSIDGVKDSTARWRSTIGGKKIRRLETRVHHDSLCPANNLFFIEERAPVAIDRHHQKFVKVFLYRDKDSWIPPTHKRLVEKGIFHRDISLRNMMRATKDPQFVAPSSNLATNIIHTRDTHATASTLTQTTSSEVEIHNDGVAPGAVHRGLVIDLDCALVSRKKDRNIAVGHRIVRAWSTPMSCLLIISSGHLSVHGNGRLGIRL